MADDASAKGGVFQPALDRILEDYARQPWLHRAFQGLYGEDHESVRALYRGAIRQNPNPRVQGSACYFLAVNLLRKPKFDEAEVVAALKRCAGEFKEVKLEVEVDGRNIEYAIGEPAAKMLFAIEHLSVGKKAPEITGTDADGKTLKLSDFRGKVVVLDFFADWCPFCVEMYPEDAT